MSRITAAPAGAEGTESPSGAYDFGWLQRRLDDVAEQGGGQVALRPGVHVSGPVRIRSNTELHVGAGAVLKFHPDFSLYPGVQARWEGVAREVRMPCIYADGESSIAITGHGTIEGSGQYWWDLFRTGAPGGELPRPTLIGLHGCSRVHVRDVELRESPSWTVHPARCENVTLENLSIFNPPDSPNTDGINPESCQNVRIFGCHIDVGDDCIAIKSGTERDVEADACENIAISNCTMVHGHGGIVLGSEMSGDIRNVSVTNCVFQGTDRGIRVKTRRGRGGVIEDVRCTNLIMDDVLCPIAINAFYFCGPGGRTSRVGDRGEMPVDDSTPEVKRLHVSHVTARRVHACAGLFLGLPERPLSEITVDDYCVSFDRDPRAGAADMAEGLESTTRLGLHLENVEDSSFTRLRVQGSVQPSVVQRNCMEVLVEGGAR